MQFVLVHPRLDVRGGAENVVLWMARALRERGHGVRVATRKLSAECWEPGEWDGIESFVLQKRKRRRFMTRRRRTLSLGTALAEELGGCDVLVAHNFPATVWAAHACEGLEAPPQSVWFCEEPMARLHWRTSMPRVAEICARPQRYPWIAHAFLKLVGKPHRKAVRRLALDEQLDRHAVARFDRLLANSRFTAENASRVFGRAFEPCPLGAPAPRLPAGPAASGEPYLAWIGSPAPHKNAWGLLEAVRIAVHEHGASDLRLRAVGIDHEPFHRAIAEKQIGAQVQIAAWQSSAELTALLRDSRALVYPPIDEPFGLVPAEAMALGRPIVASSIGGPSETVVNHETGLLADPLDPAALAQAMLELWNDPARCEKLGAAGRERWQASYSFDCFMDRFEAAIGAAGAARPAQASASQEADSRVGRRAARRSRA